MDVCFCVFYFFTLQFLKKLNRLERVVEEVKLVIKPFYNKKQINKDEYKDIMRRAVPKVGGLTEVGWDDLWRVKSGILTLSFPW